MLELLQVKEILKAELLCCFEMLKNEATNACGADLMSDVLAFTKEKTLLLTGLVNIQVIRTAEMSDLVGIVFVRGKRPTVEIVELARKKGIPILITDYPLYEACGLLYINGLMNNTPRGTLNEG